nr:receptor-like protein 12 [Ipomoea batatas]
MAARTVGNGGRVAAEDDRQWRKTVDNEVQQWRSGAGFVGGRWRTAEQMAVDDGGRRSKWRTVAVAIDDGGRRNPLDYCVLSSIYHNSYEGVQNSYPKTISWNSSIDCCLWDGVTCDESTGQVVELELSCSRLIGTIDSNSTLFHLSHLQKLNLAGNRFDGSFISHKFGDFSYLTHLNLSTSRFSGQIPSKILHLHTLISLDLSDTYYYSSPLEIGNHDFMFLLQNATQLRELVLDGIPIHSSIPPNVSSSITTLSLSYTELQGSLPSNIFHLPNLQKLFLEGNKNLSIHFPSTRWNSSLSLSYLDLSSTGCPPNIIESLRNLSRVKYLRLANCGLSGKVSEAILDLEQLTALDLSDNSLEGGFPDLFIKLWRLKKLFLYSNSFTAQFPSSITNITQLEALELSNNSLYGTVPSWLFNHSTLYLLDLSSNQLQGSIPTSLSKQKNLIILDLSSNNFSGTVELNMFSNLKRIILLDLSNNRISLVSNSKINSTSWLENLFYLSLSSCNVTNLNFLRDSKSIEYLDLSNNKIQGRIPEWAWSNWQDTLWYLNLSHNYLTSVEGIQLHSIGVIDLQFNLLEGPLPIPSSPSLRYYFASQNKLSGELGNGQSKAYVQVEQDRSESSYQFSAQLYCFSPPSNNSGAVKCSNALYKESAFIISKLRSKKGSYLSEQ